MLIKWFKGLGSNAQVGLMLIPLSVIVISVAAAQSPKTKQITNAGSKTQKTEPEVIAKALEEEQTIPFSSTTVESSSLPKGTTRITTQGVNGTQVVTYKITYKDGVEQSRVRESARVTLQPVTQVTTMGTYVAPAPSSAVRTSSGTNCDPNYSPCIPNVSYDLDCPDVGRTVSVTGYDKHRLDRDGDGVGCEAY